MGTCDANSRDDPSLTARVEEARWKGEATVIRSSAPESFLDRLTPRLGVLSQGQQAIANLLVKESHGAAFLTAADVATRTGLSESTVVRFAQALGYEGYLEMRQALAVEAQQRIGKQARFLRAPERTAAALA